MQFFRKRSVSAEEKNDVEKHDVEEYDDVSKERFGFNITCNTPATLNHFLKNGGIIILASPDVNDAEPPRAVSLINTMGQVDFRNLRFPAIASLIRDYKNIDEVLSQRYATMAGLGEFINSLPPHMRQPIKVLRYAPNTEYENKETQSLRERSAQYQFITQLAPESGAVFLEDVSIEMLPVVAFFTKKTKIPIFVTMKSEEVTGASRIDGQYIRKFLKWLFSDETMNVMTNANKTSILQHMDNEPYVRAMINLGVKPDDMAKTILSQLYAVYVYSDKLVQDEDNPSLAFYPSESFSFCVEHLHEQSVLKNDEFYTKLQNSPIQNWADIIADEVVSPQCDLEDYTYSGMTIEESIDCFRDGQV